MSSAADSLRSYSYHVLITSRYVYHHHHPHTHTQAHPLKKSSKSPQKSRMRARLCRVFNSPIHRLSRPTTTTTIVSILLRCAAAACLLAIRSPPPQIPIPIPISHTPVFPHVKIIPKGPGAADFHNPPGLVPLHERGVPLRVLPISSTPTIAFCLSAQPPFIFIYIYNNIEGYMLPLHHARHSTEPS